MPLTDRDGSKVPERMTVAELKAWLTTKGAPTKGKKSDLLNRYNRFAANKTIILLVSIYNLCFRVNACIKYGWDKTERNEESPVVPGVELKYPENGWLPLNDGLGQSQACPDFNMSHIVAYFVARTVQDFLPAGDFK